jgi:hypothetical protein
MSPNDIPLIKVFNQFGPARLRLISKTIEKLIKLITFLITGRFQFLLRHFVATDWGNTYIPTARPSAT